MKTVISSLVLILLGWTVWPYYALYNFANALQLGDPVALEGRVAWDSVRQGLRDDLNGLFMQKIRKDGDGSALATGLAAAVGPAIIDRTIDGYVTPRGVALLVGSGRVPTPNAAHNESAGDQKLTSTFEAKQSDRLHWEQVRYAFFFGGPMTFRVDITPNNAQAGQEPVILLFKWAGDWKLSRLFFPWDAIENTQAGADQPTAPLSAREETQDEIRSRRDVEARAAKEFRKETRAAKELRKDQSVIPEKKVNSQSNRPQL